MAKEKKSWYKRWWAIVLFVFVGLIILGNIVSTEETNSSETTKAEVSAGEAKVEVVKAVTPEKADQPSIIKSLEDTKQALEDYQDKTSKLDECTRVCAGEDYKIPRIKDEWYLVCYQLYYNLGLEALDEQIAECKR